MTEAPAFALDRVEPSTVWALPLQALWWDARGEWHRAHDVISEDPTAESAWVHAYLHRKEGDQANAAYWYRRAGRQPASGSLADERAAIVTALSVPGSGHVAADNGAHRR